MSSEPSASRQVPQGLKAPDPPVRGTRKQRAGRDTQPQAIVSTPSVSRGSTSVLNYVCEKCGHPNVGSGLTSVSSGVPVAPGAPELESTGESLPVEGSNSVEQKRRPPKTRANKFHDVMAMFGSKTGFTLAEFFQLLFDPKTELTNSETAMLSAWLQGGTKSGIRPVELVANMYQHPLSITFENGKLRHSTFTELAPQSQTALYLDKYPRSADLLPSPSSSPHHFNAREGLEELFARATLGTVDLEAERLCAPESGLSRGYNATWDVFGAYSLASEQSTIQEHAPVSWAIASTLAWNRSREWKPPVTIEEEPLMDQNADTPVTPALAPTSTASSERARNPVLGVLLVFFILLLFRNQNLNLFQHFLAIFLFACGSPKSVFLVLSRLGVASAHATVHNILDTLADSGYRRLQKMARNATESARDSARTPQEYFLLLFDNVNKYHKARKQTVSKDNQLKSGTASTAVGLEDVPPNAFHPEAYFANLHKQERRNMTLDKLYDDINNSHLRNAGIGMIMRLMMVHIPALKRLSGDVEDWFEQNCTRLKLRLRKSDIQPMGTSGIDESTASGGSDVLQDLVEQMKLKAEDLKHFLIMVCGDWLSVDRLRKAIQYKAKDSNIYEQRRWALPIVQLWHMKWAFLKVIYKTHWSDRTGPDVAVGLRHGLEALGRSFNHTKCDFYPGHEGLKLVFDTLVLTSVLSVVKERLGIATDTGQDDQNTHMLSDLRSYFGPGGLHAHFNLPDLLELASSVYDRFMTTSAYLDSTSMKDLDLDSNQITEALASLMVNMGAHKRRSKPQAAGTQPEAEAESQMEPTLEADVSMDVENTQGAEKDSDDSQSSGTEDMEGLNPTSGVPLAKLGDPALGNAQLLMRDGFWYLEFVLRFTFWGGGATNYGNELLELACNYFYEYPADLQSAILNNYLVNPSGLPNHWHELDLLQEHHNLWIKHVFNKKNSDFDSKFLRRAVSVNIRGFGKLRDTLLHMLGLSAVSTGRSLPDYEHDIDVLATHYRRSDLFTFKHGRFQAFSVVDTFSRGYEKLESGALAKFLDRTLTDPDLVCDEDDDQLELEGLGEPPAPLAYENGRLGPAEDTGLADLFTNLSL
ncbi:hypothetical protein FS749_015455 [Ceratobasidium sp. UAMH 11750]|nr:hypothetical protein FS749_015455 [Ceratobasidium sp. UAMH 11750]